MTGSKVLLDTWAWWEILGGTPKGVALARRYLKRPRGEVLTSAITLGELSAKLVSRGRAHEAPQMWASVRGRSSLVDATSEVAYRAGLLRGELRQRDPNASLADAIVLTTARARGATLVSADPAFDGLADVRSS